MALLPDALTALLSFMYGQECRPMSMPRTLCQQIRKPAFVSHVTNRQCCTAAWSPKL